MKTTHLFLACLCTQFTLALSAGEVSKPNKSSQAADLARQADARLQDASSPQNYREAAALLEKSVKLDPGDLDVRQKLGWVYLEKLREPQKAYPHLAMVAKNRPDDVDARKLCGMACSQTGRKWKAVEEFRAAAKLQPDDLWVRANLARSLARIGETDEAETIYSEILKADPVNPDARLGQAEIAAWRGHTTGPLQTLDQLAVENPTNADVLTLRGDIHRWNWDLTEARQDYQQALSAGENNYAARDGLEKAHWMGASGLTVKGYQFKDNTDFKRQSLEANARVHLADPVYLLAGAAGWRFSNPGFSDLDRGDGTAGLEIHFARWLEVAAVGNVFDYENRDAFFGGRFVTKISPTSGTDLYANAAYNQPFVSSISTVQNGMKEESVGFGLDTKLAGRLSFQAAGELARLSDDNKWWEAKPQLSYRVFDVPKTFLRAEYDYLSYSGARTNYWTPRNRHTVGPVLDTSIPLGKNFHIDADAKAPFVFDESEFGFQAEGGPVIDLFNHLQLKASYYYSSIPGDQGAWSGRGWQASLQIRF